MNRSHIEKTLSGIKAGDISMLETIYKHDRRPFIKFAKKYNMPEEDIIDIYQDAIIALRDNIVNGTLIHINSTIATYLFSIGKYMIYKKKKNDGKHSELTEATNYLDESIDGFLFFEEVPSKEQQLVNSCLERLGQKCQLILKLFYYEGLTLEEIQHYFNYDNYNVVKSQKSRCLKTLKDLINKHKHNG